MKKKSKKTAKKRSSTKTAKKAAKKKASKKAAKKATRKNLVKEEEEHLNYDTRIEVVEKRYKFKTGYPPDTKLGDFFKSKKEEGKPFLRMLELDRDYEDN